eukprot:15136804-Alexandrium_andersonii.AAC.1
MNHISNKRSAPETASIAQDTETPPQGVSSDAAGTAQQRNRHRAETAARGRTRERDRNTPAARGATLTPPPRAPTT